MKKHLLYTSHYENSLAEIKAAGGRVSHKFSNHVFVAYLPESATGSKLNHSSTDPLSNLDDVSSLLVNAWKELETNPQQQPVKEESGFFWDNDHAHTIEDSSQVPVRERAIGKQMRTPAGPPSPTTQQLTGIVVIGIAIVSGPEQQGLNFSAAEEANVTQQFLKACEFLSDKGGESADLTFVYDIQKVDITANPLKTCNSSEQCEAVYRDPALRKMGYEPGTKGISMYVMDVILRTEGAQWGFAAFVSMYPFAPNYGSYADGMKLCLKYNYPWKNGDFSLSLIVNICFLFGASPENDGNCTCAPSGLYNVPNNNCASCIGGFYEEACVMLNQSLKLCPWTMGQIGWYKTGVSGDPAITSFRLENEDFLSLVYRDAGDGISVSGRTNLGWNYNNLAFQAGYARPAGGDPRGMPMGYSFHVAYRDEFNFIVDLYYTGKKWVFQDVSALSGGAPKSAGNPGILCYNSTNLHVVYRSENNQIIDLVFDGTNWKRWENLSDLLHAWDAEGDPHIIQFGAAIDIVFRSLNGRIVDITWNGAEWNWIDLTNLAPGSPYTAGDPCIIQYGNSFHVIYRDTNGNISDIIWDGKNWLYKNLNTEAATGKKASGDPSAAIYNTNDLYIVYRDTTEKVSAFLFSGARQKWSYSDLSGSNPGTTGNPGITSIGQQLHVVYRDKNNKISVIMFDNKNWAYQQLNV